MAEVRPSMVYARDIPAGFPIANIETTRQQVRDHLASVADPYDDPAELADQVLVGDLQLGNGMLRIIGILDCEPVAPYLDPDYDPDSAQALGL